METTTEKIAWQMSVDLMQDNNAAGKKWYRARQKPVISAIISAMDNREPHRRETI